MKTLHSLIFTIATLLILQGCMPQSAGTNRKKTTASSSSTTTGTTTPTFASDEALYWFTSLKVTGTITVNQNSDTVMYLRGSNIHSFLISSDSTTNLPYYQNGKSFCLVGNYGSSNKQLRLRLVPISISNYSTKTTERLFRVDVPSRAENAAACGTASVDGIAGTAAAYSLTEICPNCSGGTYLTSTTLKLFESNVSAGTMSQIATTKVTLSTLAIKVDLSSNSSSPVSSCSTSSCEAKGFDCCIEGQCVKDASIKSSATSDSQYAQAMSEYAVNPLSFINFPNIFNICTNISHTPPSTTTPGTTPQSDAEKRVAQYLADWKCIETAQSSGSYSLCLPGAGETDYKSTKKKLAIACGCPTTYTDDERAIRCPDWGVRPLYKSSIETTANIVDFYCYTPTPENPIGPITNLNVNVPSRSAPHRFYAVDGTSYDDVSKLSSTIIQEGEDFYYLDTANRAAPVNGSYNVNSILGRMNVALSQTQPAKMIAVELGKTYIVSATSGYFTPCTQCAKDSWFQTFSAHPATTGGNGLRASGYTTSRDTYSTNVTLGNYEDTHFGRACYLPVTMIPFSHKKESSLQTQRLNRLKTQATYFINGYQKDWFGFNKGALIGSFDGVTWFGVGSGRRITATTSKLYLAINASFLDVADRTDTVVNIIPDISASVAADYDFDPTLAISDPKQNQAGTCQQYHQCSTDSDCIAQLGWEYMCADVSQSRTRWPIYDTEAREVNNQEKIGSIFEILSGTTTQGSSGKRCVYRGAGAPCVRDFTALNGQYNQKNLTCAPNFYCAALTTNRFNDEVVRSPNEFDDIFFGMDTNVLGRPLKYVTATKSLTTEVIANIKYNGGTDALGLTTSQVDDMGICRPGRSLSSTATTAHGNPDTQKRADYISQIGSCDSTQTGSSRTVSCPAIGDDLDYVPYNTSSTTLSQLREMQNACGGEAKHTSTFASAFANIEGGSLQLLQHITQPIMAADACLRRAGSVCHTDLDCGPNKMHEDAVGSMALAYFGGTEAEQNYWRESLICGQGKAAPTLGSSKYYDYELNQNRCCREIGKDFTMFTSGPATIIPENMGTNVNLVTSRLSVTDPKANYRYSRYTASKIAKTTANYPSVSATAEPAKDQWKVINETGSLTCCGGGWIRKFADGTHDWKVKNRLSLETSNFACLNYRTPLVNADYNGFGDAKDQVVQSTYQREYEYFCKYPGQNGCMQILYRDVSGYQILPPRVYEPSDAENLEPDDTTTVPPWATSAPYSAAGSYNGLPATGYTRLDTSPVGDLESGNYTYKMNQDVPYPPFAYMFTQSPPYDLYTDANGTKRSLIFFVDKDLDYGVSIYLPAYIPFNVANANANLASATPTISRVYMKYMYDDGRVEAVNITNLRNLNKATCDGVANYPGGSSGQPIDALSTGDFEAWCISANSKTQNRPVMNIKAYTGNVAIRQWKYAAVVIDFMPLEKYKQTLDASLGAVTTPGNPYYYLTKLGRLELIGIPQITYEPIYCNGNQNKLVPGIFSSSIQTRAQFNAVANTYTSFNPIASYDEEGNSESESAGIGNQAKRFTYQDKLSHAAVFSSKDFACCMPLGKETTSAAKCCSGTASTVNGKLTCKLPSGTDLNVYFNKFVSSEGVGSDQPGGGLLISSETSETEVDFNAYTGEPKMRASTFQKLEALGAAYCQSGVVQNGGSFGQFPPEPYSGYYTTTGETINYPMSIVDSIVDSVEGDTAAGKFPFDNGYRWDHHYYCK